MDWDDAERMKKAAVQLEPLAHALERRHDPELPLVTLVPYNGILILRFVRADGRRYDAAIGVPSLAAMLGAPATMRVGLNQLLRKVKTALAARSLSDAGVLVGVGGSFAPH
jgi:hypothetical protein